MLHGIKNMSKQSVIMGHLHFNMVYKYKNQVVSGDFIWFSFFNLFPRISFFFWFLTNSDVKLKDSGLP